MTKNYEIIQLKSKSSPFSNYMYLILDKHSRKIAIVDPAWDLEIIEKWCSFLDADPVCLLLTHSHYDHVNLVDKIVNKYNSNVYMSEIEINFYKFKSKNLIYLQNNDVLHLGETQIQCIFTPGHTAGGVCFLLSDSLFTGDTIFIEGCGACNGYGGSPSQMFESIQKIKEMVSEEIQVYPGHSYGKRPGYSLKYLLKHNIYFGLSRKHFIDFRMRKNQKNLFDFH